MTITQLFLPIKTVSTPNMREHWAVRAKRAKAQRSVARFQMVAALGGRKVKGGTITLDRMGKRRLDDDNLAASLKSVRDGIADAIGVDDGNEAVRYEYEQHGGCRDVGVLVIFQGELE